MRSPSQVEGAWPLGSPRQGEVDPTSGHREAVKDVQIADVLTLQSAND